MTYKWADDEKCMNILGRIAKRKQNVGVQYNPFPSISRFCKGCRFTVSGRHISKSHEI